LIRHPPVRDEFAFLPVGLAWDRDIPQPWHAIKQPLVERLGFHAWHTDDFRIDDRGIAFPIWLLTLLSSVSPLVACANYLRANRRAIVGCCTNCAYDLRATPHRCPECGTIPQLLAAPLGSHSPPGIA
jgi:hypothetical protein